ncbi:MAG TPA: ribonuclease P protein component [Halothiobacillus sp.]|jgi:ribonuclease P protein component|nr:ribonuclease P protein component [Halothiobacillus sp.]
MNQTTLASPEGFGFPVASRLTRPGDFTRVFQSGKRIHCDLLMAVTHSGETNCPRLGLAIAKRQIHRSHERNRIKRQAREHFRLNQGRLPQIDLIIMAKNGADRLSALELRTMMNQLFDKVIKRCAGS